MFIKEKGYTLIEILIVLVMVSILAAIALPTYTDYVQEGRRIDAKTDLLNGVMAQEHYRSKNTTYGSTAQILNGATTTRQGYYVMDISNNTATGYVITATATADGGQADDDEGVTSCSVLTVAVSGLTTTQTPAACWK